MTNAIEIEKYYELWLRDSLLECVCLHSDAHDFSVKSINNTYKTRKMYL